eukprot:gene10484-14087_t
MASYTPIMTDMESEIQAPRRASMESINDSLLQLSLNQSNAVAGQTQTVVIKVMTDKGDIYDDVKTLRELLDFINEDVTSNFDLMNELAAHNNNKTNNDNIMNSKSNIVKVNSNKVITEQNINKSLSNNIGTNISTKHVNDFVLEDYVEPPDERKETNNTNTSKPSLAVDSFDIPNIVDDNDETEVEETNFVSEINLRDIRRLDFKFNPNPEHSLLIGRDVVLFAMECCSYPIRAVVTSKKLILIVPDGADSILEIISQHMKDWSLHSISNNYDHHSLHENKPLFEYHAYEALLTAVKSVDEQDYTRLNTEIQSLLIQLNKAAVISSLPLFHLRKLKNELFTLLTRLVNNRNILQDLVEDDEEMALMNLTYLHEKPILYKYPLQSDILDKHGIIEEMLESYLLDFCGMISIIENIRLSIQNTEELISLRLETARNKLLITNSTLSLFNCSVAFAAYISGLFGMNLDNVILLMPIKHFFVSLFVVSFAFIFVSYYVAIRLLKRLDMLPSDM